ncbi:MAG: phage head-tail joining protein [Flavobacteriales bacterium]
MSRRQHNCTKNTLKQMASYTIDQVNTLEAAIAQGVLIVEYADKKIEYRSLDEMLRTLSIMKDALGLNKNSGRRYAVHSKGFNS